jgi:hypothetical protein
MRIGQISLVASSASRATTPLGVGRGQPGTVHPVFVFLFSFTFPENHRNFKNLEKIQ